MRPTFRTLLAGVTAAGLMGGTALAQQIILVPQPGGEGAQQGADAEQRFMLVPAPRFAPGPNEQARGADSEMAMELYRRGYQQGVSDAARAGAARQQIDPGAIERIGRELFERGYVLGMMQAQLQAQQQAGKQVAQAQAGQQVTGQQATGQQGQAAAQQGSQQAAAQGGQQDAAQGEQQAAAQQGGQEMGQLVASQVGATPQTDVPEATLAAQDSQQFGQYLTDDNGRAVYMFTADKQAQGEAQKAQSTCYDACAEAWPPVLTRSTPVKAMGPVRSELLGTIQRKDGMTQVTYNGWPLYYYVKDQGEGQATGQDVHGFGGEWYLVRPEGQKVAEG